MRHDVWVVIRDKYAHVCQSLTLSFRTEHTPSPDAGGDLTSNSSMLTIGEHFRPVACQQYRQSCDCIQLPLLALLTVESFSAASSMHAEKRTAWACYARPPLKIDKVLSTALPGRDHQLSDQKWKSGIHI
jgi:hypothetical protein